MNKWKKKTEPIRDMDRKARKKLKGGKITSQGKASHENTEGSK